jgi:hypothetical protein
MAMACCGELAPCFPSRIWSNSSFTNSPACVEGDFPSSASRWARSIASFSGIPKLLASLCYALSARTTGSNFIVIYRLQKKCAGLENGGNGIQRSLAVFQNLTNGVLAPIQSVLRLKHPASALPAQTLDPVLCGFRQPRPRVFAGARRQQQPDAYANPETYQKSLQSGLSFLTCLSGTILAGFQSREARGEETIRQTL